MSKLHKLLLLMTFIFSCISAFPQANDRLKSKRINKGLYLKWSEDKKQLFYKIDSDEQIENEGGEMKEGQLFTTTLDPIAFRFYFFNPLRTQVEIIKEDRPDPMYEDLNRLLSDAVGIAQLASGLPLKTLEGEETKKQIKAATPAGEKSAFASLNESARTDKLIQWLLFVNISEYYKCAEGTPRWGSLPTDLDSLEKYLHTGFRLGTYGVDTYKKWIDAMIDEIYKATDRQKYREALTRTQAISKLLASKNVAVDKIVKNIPASLKAIQWVNPPGEGCIPLRMHTSTIITDYASEVAEVLNLRKRSLEKLDSVLKFADDFYKNRITDTPSGEANYDYMSYSKSFEIKRRTISNFSFKVTQYLRDTTALLKKGQTITNKIDIAQYTRVVFELGSGVAFTTAQYTTFALDSTNAIRESEAKKLNFLVQLTGNFITNWELLEGVYPMFQIGVGNGKEYPSLSTGVGLRFFGDDKSRNVSLSGGIVFGFQQQLKGADLGDKVNGDAELQTHISYRIEKLPGIYLGVQYNF